jgi:hypothetical protein
MEDDSEVYISSGPVYRPVEIDKRPLFHIFIGQRLEGEG